MQELIKLIKLIMEKIENADYKFNPVSGKFETKELAVRVKIIGGKVIPLGDVPTNGLALTSEEQKRYEDTIKEYILNKMESEDTIKKSRRKAEEHYKNSDEFKEKMDETDKEVLSSIEKIFNSNRRSGKNTKFKECLKSSINCTFNPISRKFNTEDLKISFSKEWKECERIKKLKKDMEYKDTFQEMGEVLKHKYEREFLGERFGFPTEMLLTPEERELAKYNSLINFRCLKKTRNKPCTRPDDELTASIRKNIKYNLKTSAGFYMFESQEGTWFSGEDEIIEKIKEILTYGTVFRQGDNQVEIVTEDGEIYLVKGI